MTDVMQAWRDVCKENKEIREANDRMFDTIKKLEAEKAGLESKLKERQEHIDSLWDKMRSNEEKIASCKARWDRVNEILEDMHNEASRGISCKGVREANKSAFKDLMLTRVCMKVNEIKALESGGSKEVKK